VFCRYEHFFHLPFGPTRGWLLAYLLLSCLVGYLPYLPTSRLAMLAWPQEDTAEEDSADLLVALSLFGVVQLVFGGDYLEYTITHSRHNYRGEVRTVVCLCYFYTFPIDTPLELSLRRNCNPRFSMNSNQTSCQAKLPHHRHGAYRYLSGELVEYVTELKRQMHRYC
jgi:hypothetical protein